MRMLGVSELLDTAQIGQQVDGVKGIVTAVFEIKSGQGRTRPWTLQTIKIADESNPNDTLIVKIWDHDELFEAVKGKMVYLSNPTNKSLTLKDNHNPNTGQTEVQLHAAKGAVVDITGAGPQRGDRPAAGAPASQATPARQSARQATGAPARQAAQPARAAQPAPQPPETDDHVLRKYTHLFLKADNAVRKAIAPIVELRKQGPLSDEELSSIRATLFIETAKKTNPSQIAPITNPLLAEMKREAFEGDTKDQPEQGNDLPPQNDPPEPEPQPDAESNEYGYDGEDDDIPF